ncbi:MAG: flagellar basal-body rod protein FlgF [Pseudomonadota bacterium]
MPSDLYVALSGQVTMDERLTTIANNVANMRTAGFRAETVDFKSVFSETRSESVAFATVGTQHIDRRQGPIERTGNQLDVAISGDGFFAIQTPEGLAYTRDGRFTVNEAGDLLTVTGHAVTDEGGAPMVVDPARGPISFGTDGTVSQEGAVVGRIGLFAIPEAANLSRYGDAAVLSDLPVEPVEDRVLNGVRQGYLEGSNVNAVHAITELIEVQRAFEYANSSVSDRNRSLQQAVRTLGAE